jgi:hypothetical protein
MTCAECERVLPDFLEGGGSAELRSHVAGCEACSELVNSLQAIAAEAKTLQAADEPSPRVWNSLEIALRQEGLIRQPRYEESTRVPLVRRRWGAAAWLVPSLGAVLLAVFMLSNPRPAGERVARVSTVSSPLAKANAVLSADDQQMVEQIAAHAPMMTAAYETNLASVNEYIRDAQAIVDANPNDGEAQRSLMDAYEQKTLLNEIALDRSLQ